MVFFIGALGAKVIGWFSSTENYYFPNGAENSLVFGEVKNKSALGLYQSYSYLRVQYDLRLYHGLR